MQISSALSSGKDLAADTVLAKYNTQHKMATKLLYLATNAIVKLYTDDRIIAKFFVKRYCNREPYCTSQKGYNT